MSMRSVLTSTDPLFFFGLDGQFRHELRAFLSAFILQICTDLAKVLVKCHS